MKQNLVSFIAGLIFALGLGISGMTQPQKILAFLNLAGAWNPALLGVMGAAVLVFGLTFFFAHRRRKPVLSETWHLPKAQPISKSLCIGAALFGMGWGLSGYCPGPAVVSLVSLRTPTMIFVASMLAGMALFMSFDKARSRK